MTTAQEMVQKYMDAEMAVLEGRSVSFGGRSLTMENLSEIRKGRTEWERRASAQAQRLSGGTGHSLASFQ